MFFFFLQPPSLKSHVNQVREYLFIRVRRVGTNQDFLTWLRGVLFIETYKMCIMKADFCVCVFTLSNQGIDAPSSRRSRYLLPPEELLEEVVRLRLSAPISLLTRVRRSVDILFLEEILNTKSIHYSKNRHLSGVMTVTEATRCKIERKKINYFQVLMEYCILGTS